ncbi:MAG: amidohydrolase family protein [Desulforegulaceae bacterium]|nr:amidohydrolase family protein [Desulforegulaceae bacterium]
MKIVNSHVHMVELDKMIEKMGNIELSGGISVLKDLESTLPLLNVDVLLSQMDEAGVEESFLFAVEAPIVYASNEYVKKLCDLYPQRFTGIASVNPLSETAVEDLEYAVKKLGLKGLKLHPPLQNFFMNDKKVFPVYQKAVDLDIPVIFHVGTTPFGSLCRLSQANPLLVDDVAVEFPDLRIMLTHLGTLWHNESFMVVEKNPNVYIDTAAYLYEIKELLNSNLIERIGSDKIIFGTDYPMPYAGKVHKIKDFVDCIKNLDIDENIKTKIFSENYKSMLYGKKGSSDSVNAEDMLKIHELKKL